MSDRPIFKMLWDMVNAIEKDGYKNNGLTRGTIIGRYAGMIDDRIENSGYSRSVDSLKLYDTKQLKDELRSRLAELRKTL